MMTRWMPAQTANTECPSCRKLVSARLAYRTVTLTRTRLRVADVLVDVCPECDGTIDIPRASLAQLREAGVPK
jgi:hypothetical protein